MPRIVAQNERRRSRRSLGRLSLRFARLLGPQVHVTVGVDGGKRATPSTRGFARSCGFAFYRLEYDRTQDVVRGMRARSASLDRVVFFYVWKGARGGVDDRDVLTGTKYLCGWLTLVHTVRRSRDPKLLLALR